MPKKLKSLLAIAGSDPMGGAGIQADIRAGSIIGVHVLTAITAITSQNSKGLIDSGVVSPRVLKNQLDTIIVDTVPDAIKIGLVGDIENLKVIKDFLESLPDIPIVVDPIIKITAGTVSQKNIDISPILKFYIEEIFPSATVVTPNLDELNSYTGDKDINENLLDLLNCRSIIVKGGHSTSEILTDYLITPDGILTASHPKIHCMNLHGTGCLFSSLLAGRLAIGESLDNSFYKTSYDVANIISQSCDYRLGKSSYGPLNINENYIL